MTLVLSSILCLVVVMATVYQCHARAQFNLFPHTWNSHSMGHQQRTNANRGYGFGCSTLLDIQTHGSTNCPRDFNHQYFDTHSCQFVCFSEINDRSAMFDQNGVAGGNKPRSRLP